MDLRQRIATRMTRLAAAGLLRTLQPPRGIDLCSNDYLGLSQHPELKRRMAEAVLREGCGSTGSRLLRGERSAFSAIEKRFARFKRTEAALYFSSGYAANLAVLAAFLETDDAVFSDELNHASLIDGMRLGRARKIIFPHSNVAALRKDMERGLCRGQRFIIAESVFSMDGDIAPLKDYAALAESAGASLIIDEAHAAGIFGERGSGCIEAENIGSAVLVSINPMGKAFGCAGAFVCGPWWAIDYLAQRARPFVFSTAPPPSIAAALDAALDLVEKGAERRKRVLSLARYLRALLAERGFDVAPQGSQIIPILIGGNAQAMSVAGSLQNAGFDVRAIRPPTVPEGTARLRVSVNAGLTEAILRSFTDALCTAMRSAAAA
jgi:8-amino-7-oxononanoate synthase